MKKCPKCKSECDNDALFCDKCGYQFPNNGVCPHCGAELKPDSLFCPKCGKAINEKVVEENKSKQKEIIQKYKEEIVVLEKKKSDMFRLGLALLLSGILLLIVFLIMILIGNSSSVIITSYVVLIFMVLFINVGIVFLIIQRAVFGNKISNRKHAINQHESCN